MLKRNTQNNETIYDHICYCSWFKHRIHNTKIKHHAHPNHIYDHDTIIVRFYITSSGLLTDTEMALF